MTLQKVIRPATAEEYFEALEKDEYIIGSLMRLYSFQTHTEQMVGGTVEQNNMGFNGPDGEICSNIAEFYNSKKFLTRKQLDFVKGKLMKYSRQMVGQNILPMPIQNIVKKEKAEEFPKAKLVYDLIEIRFPFNGDTLNKVKSLSGRRWNAQGKYWTAPLLIENIQKLVEWEFLICPELEAILKDEMQRGDSAWDFSNHPALEGFFGYQKEGVGFVEKKKGRALIGDEMGLGKTWQALGWLKIHPEIRQVVIVCPASLKLNWLKEAKNLLNNGDGRSIAVVSGKKPYEVKEEIVIINYDILQGWKDYLDSRCDLLILDECFPYETKVTTDKGQIKIGNIVENKMNVKILSYDFSNNVLEFKKILHYNKNVNHKTILKITHEKGSFTCTANHKIWTENGYKKAEEILREDKLYLVREKVRKNVFRKTKILLNKLLCKMENGPTRIKKENIFTRKSGENFKSEERNKKTRCFFTNEEKQSIKEPQNSRKNKKNKTTKWDFTYLERKKRREWSTNDSANEISKSVELGNGSTGENKKRPSKWLSNLLQNRCSKLGIKNWNRNRWQKPQTPKINRVGQKKDFSIRISRVVDIEILERGNNESHAKSKKNNQFVYNIEVEKNHNYIANNILVKNCHYTKNSKAQRTKAVKKLADKKGRYVIALTGTPIINRPVEFFNILNMLDKQRWPSFWKYAHSYCGAKNNGFGWDFTGATNLEELNEKIQSTMIRRLKADVLKELPPKVRTVIPLEIGNRKEYQKAAKDLIGWIMENEGGSKAAKASQAEQLVRFERLKQLVVKGKMKAAVEWIKDVLETNGKLVVFCTHKVSIDLLRKELSDFYPVVIDGSTPQNSRQLAVDMFQNEENCRVFIGNIKAAGVGLTLTAASATCFIELGWTPGEHDQAEDRVHRIGQTADSVQAYYLLADDTIEMEIAELLDKKRKVLNAVLDGQDVEETSLLTELMETMKGEIHG